MNVPKIKENVMRKEHLQDMLDSCWCDCESRRRKTLFCCKIVKTQPPFMCSSDSSATFVQGT